MESNRTVPTQTDPVTAKPAPTITQRWLLLSVLFVGVLFRLGFTDLLMDGWLGTFWLVAMAAVTPFIWRRAVKSRTGLACGVAAITLCVLQIVHFYENTGLNEYFALGIPTAMALYLVFSAYEIPVQREGEAAGLAVKTVFVYPFSGVPVFFRAIISLFTGKGRGAWKRWLIGAVIGIPLAAGVTFLLTRADYAMSRLFSGLFADMQFERWLDSIVLVYGAAMLFYGPFERASRKELPAVPEAAPASWPASTMAIILIPSLAVYAVFACLQFSYLFGGALPAELTYSEYARQGFTELNLVAAINFTVFGLTQRYAKPHRALAVLSALLLVATGSIVASCIVRLLLYIGAYGLTMLRILPLWLAVFLAVLTILCAVRLWKKSFPVLRASGLVFLYWYVLLNIPDWGALIASYNRLHGMG